MEMYNTGESDTVFPLQIVKSHWDFKTRSVFKQTEASFLSCDHVQWVPVYSDSNAFIKLLCFVTKNTPWKQLERRWAMITTAESSSVALLEMMCTGRLQWNRLLLLSVWVSPDFPSTPSLPTLPSSLLSSDFHGKTIMPFLSCFHVLKLVNSYRLLLLCVHINLAISCRAGCDRFVQVPGWRWHRQCQAITGLLFALCLSLYEPCSVTCDTVTEKVSPRIFKKTHIFLMQTRKRMALQHCWKSATHLCLSRSWISEGNLPWYLANRSTQILRQLYMAFPQEKML